MFKNPKKEIIVDGHMKVHEDFEGLDNLLSRGYTINPAYAEREQQRKSTKGIPKYIPMFDKIGAVYRFPRGFANSYIGDKRYTIIDNTIEGEEVDFKSNIVLRKKPEDQETFVKPLLKSVKETYGAVGQGSAGTGKGHPWGTLIYTEKGPKPIEEIEVGDTVIGSNGKNTEVVGVFDRGEIETYKISFCDGVSIECDKDHLFTVKDAEGTIRTQTVTQLKEYYDEMEGKEYLEIPVVKPIEFESRDVYLDPLDMGMILGGKSPSGYERYCLDEMGIDSTLPEDLFIPSEYKYNSLWVREELIRGMLSYIGPKSYTGREFTFASKSLAEDFREVVQTLGGTVRIITLFKPVMDSNSEVIDEETLYQCYVYGRHDLFEAKTKFVIEREAERRIVGITYVGKKPIICLGVDAEDKLYCAEHCVVTHNTIMTLDIISKIGRPALVIVHKTFLVNQWIDRIESVYSIDRSEIGIVRQDVCQYKGKKIVIALVQSLLSRDYGEDFYNYFGLIAVDEVHRFGAETFREAIPMFKARYRIGVTATPERSDGQEEVVYGHIGPIKSVLVARGEKPEIHQVTTPVIFDRVAKKQISVYGEVNLAKLITYLGEHEARNKAIVDYVVSAVEAGRKIIILSGRRNHLERLRELILRECRRRGVRTTVAYYVGGMTEKELTIAEHHQVLLGTLQMAKEGLDIPELDTLFLTTPISDIEQAVGRILRFHEGKKQPMVVDFVDKIGICYGMANKRRKEYQRLGYKIIS